MSACHDLQLQLNSTMHSKVDEVRLLKVTEHLVLTSVAASVQQDVEVRVQDDSEDEAAMDVITDDEEFVQAVEFAAFHHVLGVSVMNRADSLVPGQMHWMLLTITTSSCSLSSMEW